MICRPGLRMAVVLASALLFAQPGRMGAQSAPATSTATAATRPAVSVEDIGRLVAQLGDDDPKLRDAASKALWQAGRAAMGPLRVAAAGKDAEAASRAREILGKFEFGLLPDTPPDVRAIVEQYRSAWTAGDYEARGEVLQKLLDAGAAARGTLFIIVRKEQATGSPAGFLAQFESQLATILPQMILDGKLDEASAELEKMAACGDDRGMRSLASFLLERGGLKARIEKLAKSADNPTLLAYLHRANGDLPKAADVARSCGDIELLENILIEQGKWAELLKLDPLIGRSGEPEYVRLGRRAAYQRLGGDKAGFDKSIARLLEIGKSTEEWYQVLKQLMINDAFEQAMDMLKDKPAAAHTLLEFQRARWDYASLLKQARQEPDGPLPEGDEQSIERYKLGREHAHRAELAGLLLSVGEDKEALAILDELMAKPPGNVNWSGIMFTLVRHGHRDKALEQVRKRFESDDGHGYPAAGALWGGQDMQSWWSMLVPLYPGENPSKLSQRLQDFMENGSVEAAAELVKSHVRRGNGAYLQQSVHQLLLSRCHDGKDVDKILGVIDAVPQWNARPELAINLAVVMLRHDRAKQAVARLQTATGPAQPDADGNVPDSGEAAPQRLVLEFLRGYALAKSGKETEGKNLMALASLAVLNQNYSLRWQLIDVLRRLDERDTVRAQEQIIIRTSAFNSADICNALTSLADDEKACDARSAAIYTECNRMASISPALSIPTTYGYMKASLDAHVAKARVHIEAKEFDKAMDEMALARAALPADIDSVIHIWPILVKAGRKDLAEKCFAAVWDFHSGLLKTYPGLADSLNSHAWMSARCGHRLEEGLKASQKSVELRPRSVAYMDTLAEVNFQLGNKDKAVEIMTRCIELDRKNGRTMPDYLARQLKRFEKGDKATEPK